MFGWLKERRERKMILSSATGDYHDAIALSGYFLRLQLKPLSDEEVRGTLYLDTNFARGYIDGFISATVDLADEVVINPTRHMMLTLIGYDRIFSGDMKKAIIFAARSREIFTAENEPEYIFGRKTGADEFNALRLSQTEPDGLSAGLALYMNQM